MLTAIKELSNAIKAINTLHVNMKKDIDFEGDYKQSENYSIVKDAYFKLLSAAYELSHLKNNIISEIKSFYDTRNFTKKMFNMINDKQSATEFVEYLYSVTKEILNNYEAERFWIHDYDYEWRKERNSPVVPVQIFEAIAKSVKLNTTRRINILDPRCGNGENIFNFSVNLKNNDINTKSFAICQNSYIEQDRFSVDRLIFKGERKISVTKNVFDIVFSVPEIILEEDIFTKNNKYNFLTQEFSYLRPDGILIIVMPFYKINDYYATQLLKNVKNLQWIPVNNETILFIGQKRDTKLNNKDIDIHEFRDLKNIISIFEEIFDSKKEIHLNMYTLPNNYLEVEKFRGGKITEDEIEQNCMSSQSMQDFLKSQETDFNIEYKQKPLLPFTLGQIGLILTSGFLDGIINESDRYKHVVKGQVKRYVESKNDVEIVQKKMNIEEVSSNRVEINLFLPDGTFKSLV